MLPTVDCSFRRSQVMGKTWHSFAVCGLILFSSGSCGQPAPSGDTPKIKPVVPSAANPIKKEGAAAPNNSSVTTMKPPVLFGTPEFELTDQNGEKFPSRELVGRVWIANFFFTHCQATCPRQTAKLAELQTRIGRWPHRNRVRFLSITVDPERDTPARLLEYAVQNKADSTRWKFLTGDRGELRRISKEGFKFPVADNADDTANPITHSSRFVLVDAQSRVRGVYESLSNEDSVKLLEDIQLVLSEPVLNAPDPVQIGVKGDIFDPPWMEQRQSIQLATADQIQAFHDFRFEDQIERSGIKFIDRPVADAAKDFKSNHYDHANGVAAADIDGDGLVDLYFTSQVGGNQLYRNLGDGRFENITVAAGVGLEGRVSVAASFADTDNDGDPDLYVTTTRHGNAFFVNDGQGHFEDRTDDAGLTYSGHSSAADFFDYDRDGRLDLLVTNVGKFTTETSGYTGDPEKKEFPYYIGTEKSFAGHLFASLSERSILYHNEGNNQFRDVSDETGFTHRGWSGDATPLDANGDGWIDLYVLNMQGNDVYYENIEGKRFEDRSRTMFPAAVWGGMGVKSFDYNNDGRMDLYITNMHADMWQLDKGILGPDEKKRVPPKFMPESYLQSRVPGKNILGSALYECEDTGRYREVATDINADNFWPWGPSIGDLNADGFQDLFIASCMNYPYRYHPNSVLINEHGKQFRDAEFILGIEPRRAGRTAVPWFELDCSGADAKHHLSQGRDGKITVWGAVGTRSAVIFDIDRDGDLDIVTNDFNSPPMVLISSLNERHPGLRYLAVQLRGTRSNRDGLGATVEVTLRDRVLTQVHDGQSGYLSQSSLPLYFGLGDALKVDKITVRWPDGASQTVNGPVDTNQNLLIVEE